MRVRKHLTVERGTLAVLWLGMAGFVVLHSVLLVTTASGRTRSLIRLTWFVGLGVLIALIVIQIVRVPADE